MSLFPVPVSQPVGDEEPDRIRDESFLRNQRYKERLTASSGQTTDQHRLKCMPVSYPWVIVSHYARSQDQAGPRYLAYRHSFIPPARQQRTPSRFTSKQLSSCSSNHRIAPKGHQSKVIYGYTEVITYVTRAPRQSSEALLALCPLRTPPLIRVTTQHGICTSRSLKDPVQASLSPGILRSTLTS